VRATVARLLALRRLRVASVVLAVVVPPLVTSPADLEDLSRLLVLTLAVLGVGLLAGTSGLISLGHAIFVGFGAFCMANLLDTPMPAAVALVVTTVATGALGMLVGIPAVRVRGPYLALITFGLSVIFTPLGRFLSRFTGAPLGKTVDIESYLPPKGLGLDERLHLWNYGVVVTVVGIWFLLAHNLLGSRMGRAVRATRDQELAASTFGINLAWAKTGIFGVSAAMAGTAGALQAVVDPFLQVNTFDWMQSLEIYASAIIGGVGSLLGALLGVVILIVMPALNTAIGLFDSAALAFGVTLLIVTFVAPDGLAGRLARLAEPVDDSTG